MLWFPWTFCQMGFQYLKPNSQHPSCSLLELSTRSLLTFKLLHLLLDLQALISSWKRTCLPFLVSTEDIFITTWHRLWRSQGGSFWLAKGTQIVLFWMCTIKTSLSDTMQDEDSGTLKHTQFCSSERFMNLSMLLVLSLHHRYTSTVQQRHHSAH